MAKKYFTREQIQLLKPAEEYFNTVVHSHYKRASYRELNELVADIYLQATGEQVARNWGCGSCVMTCYEKAGRLYYESKEYWEAMDRNINDGQLMIDFDAVDHTEMIKETMDLLDLNEDGSEKKVEKNLSEGTEHPEAQEPVSGAESTENNGVSDTVSKYLETEPAPKPKQPKKTVAKNKAKAKKK